jgi:predicted DNA-binding transcriptional regulator AlpA
MESPRLLSVNEVARYLTISTREVWRRADSGQLPKPLHLGGKVRRWLREEIEAVVELAKRRRGV